MLTLEEGIELHAQVHKNPSKFNGHSLLPHENDIKNLIDELEIESVLDYGCGKALGWFGHKFHEKWNIPFPTLYDPGFEPFSEKPKGKYDLVICTDVMEHIPENSVEYVLNDIFNYATKAVYFEISKVPAVKKLPNGMNAHLTIKSEEWWQEKIKLCNVNTIVVKGG